MKSRDERQLKWLCDNLHRLNFISTETLDPNTNRILHTHVDPETGIKYLVVYEGFGSYEILVDIETVTT